MSVTVNWENNDFAQTLVGYGEYHFMKDCIYDATALYNLGEVEGKSLLDLGCGEGQFCRLVKSKGGSRVLGVDISPLMIEKSKQHDVEGICEYQVGNIYEIGKIGEFDYVVSNLVIPYAKCVDDLLSMTQCFYDNLKPGGRFVGIALNCLKGDYDWGKSLEKYGVESFTRVSKVDTLTTIDLILTPVNQKRFKSTIHFFEPQVYENAFLQSGFRSFAFKQPYRDEKKLEIYPKIFWDHFFENPCVVCYVAEK